MASHPKPGSGTWGPPSPPPAVAGKTFEASVALMGDPAGAKVVHFHNIPETDLLAIEGALLALGPGLNANPPPKQAETQPRINTLTLTAVVSEVTDSTGTKHATPQPFFGPVVVPWHNVPAYAAPYLWNLVSTALQPFGKYLAPLLLALLLLTSTTQAQTVVTQPPVGTIVVQPGPVTIGPPTIAQPAPLPAGPAATVYVRVTGWIPARGIYVSTPGAVVQVGRCIGGSCRSSCSGGRCR
jgi:hypothetical protein